VLLDLILHYDCNLACRYCTCVGMRGTLSTAAAVAALREGRRDGYDRVSFTGGEPTLRDDLLGLVRAAKQLGYASVKLQSNGLLLAEPRNVERLLDAGVDRWHVSIHTHDARAYEHLVQREGTHALMVAALADLAARGLDPTADVILEASTHRRLPACMRWLHALGVRRVHLWFVSLTDRNRDNVASLPRMTDVVPDMREAFAFGRAHGMDVRSLHVPRCLLGDDHAHAWDPASEGVRVVSPDARFDLRGSRLAGQTHVPACRGCAFESVCPGVRPDYVARFGDGEIAAARGHPP
jgi:cyclic pyranopterin phosphate synthase